MAKARTVITLEVDSTGAIKKIDQFKGKVSKIPQAAEKANRGLNSMTTALRGLAVAYGAIRIGRFVRESIQAASDQQRVFQSLASSLSVVGVSYNDVSGDLQGFLSKLQDTTRYGDTDTAEALQRLTAITGDYGAAMKLLTPTLDFATAMHIDLATAARLTGQAATGMTGTLSRYGIVLSETTKDQIANADSMERANIMARELQQRFGGAAAADLDTYGGRVSRLSNYWGDFKEALGDVIVKTAAAPGVFDSLTEAIKRAIDWAKNFGEALVFIGNIDYDVTLLATIDEIALGFLKLNQKADESALGIVGAFASIPGMIGAPFRAALGKIADDLSVVNKAIEIQAKTISRDWAGALDKADAAVLKYDKAVNNLTASSGDLTGAMADSADAVGDLGDELKDLPQYINAGSQSFQSMNQFLVAGSQSFRALTQDVRAVGPAAVDSANIMQSTFSDLLGRGFIGELETFGDLWDAIWQDLAKSMMGILGDAFEDVFSGNKGIGQGFSDFFAEMKKPANALGGALGGAGMVYSGYQQGGTGGFLQGALGGALAGSMFGPIGAVVGGVIGGIVSLFGGDDTPSTRLSISPTGGTVDVRNQDIGGNTGNSLWVQQRVQEYRASIMAMNDVLRIFGDGDLFALIADAPTIAFEGGDANQVAEIFRERWLPGAMRQMFHQAINTGLGNFGVDIQTQHRLWAEIGALTGDAQIQGLETFISSLVGISNLYDDMNWNAITDESRQNSLQIFLGGLSDTLDAVQAQMLGLDQMTLLERADQAQTIEQLITQARGAEIQMLRQIDQLQNSINRSIDAQIEGLRTGGMSDAQLQDFYSGQIDSLMAQLRSGVDSPEAIQQIMSDLQRYIGLYQQALGDQLYNSAGFGGTYADQLISILEEARGLSNDALEAMRDQIRDSNDALIAELQRLIDALTHYGDVIAPADPTTPRLDGHIGIDVNVFAEDGFGAWVDARIERWRLRFESENGPN